MKCTLSIMLILFFLSPGNKEISIDKEYFLVGTLNDFNGRKLYERNRGIVDNYNFSEAQLFQSIHSLFESAYPDLKTTEHENGFQIYSETLAEMIESFYSYQPTGEMVYTGEDDLSTLDLDSLVDSPEFYASNFDTVYIGTLKNDIFKTDGHKASFITGAYARYGWKVDSQYHIKVYNAPTKMSVLSDQLRHLGCADINQAINRDHIPTSQTISFTPTEQLKNYLEKYANKN